MEELKARKKREIEAKRDKTLEELIERREPKLEPSSVLILNVSKENTLEELHFVLRRFGEVISCHVLGPRTEEEKVCLQKNLQSLILPRGRTSWEWWRHLRQGR